MNYNPFQLYQRCLNANYIHVEHDGDYAIEREGNTLFLFLEWSHGGADWANNFKFFAKPYKHMDTKWRCHRGFLRIWKSIEPYVKDQLLDPTVEKIIIVGYSQGAAVAGLAHEYVWYNRQDLREGKLVTYAFGAPRFYWGWLSSKLKQRWASYIPIRNINDLVTHVPPNIFGFRHITKIISIGGWGRYNCIDAHRPQSYLKELGEIYNEQRIEVEDDASAH